VRSLAAAIRPGVVRGLIELRQSFAGGGLVGHLLWPVVTLIAMFLLRDTRFEGTDYSLSKLMLPGVLGMFVAFGTLLTIQYLAADREDGTLLRAKATPNGIAGYFIAKLVTVSLTVLVYLVILLVPGWVIVGGLDVEGPGSWLALGGVVVLGLLATQPIGVGLGALITSPRGAGYLSLLVMALVAISGIFYPITALPGWIQAVAQVFPMYWLSLGVRAALLPNSAAAVEIAGAWRALETLVVLGTWAVIGLILAPIVVRRMARRESGSSVARRREALLRRVA
jgi:ABC-2 type transport system permease protein